ncbi:hypothetical protein [Morganella morganii]|uniref:hypothetical protein n=1 Tax=Morganella morganii TaxID=582 RepID=UPI003783E5B7|nr:hypothetical protein SUGSMm_22060 [Morganella morganii subsp. sibonii]
MSKYRDKSDFEINLCVAQIIFTDSEYDVIKQSMEVVKFQNGNGKGTCHAFDPCNNPADVMPIVIKSRIAICPIFLLIGVQHPIVMLIELLTRTHYVQLWKYS